MKPTAARIHEVLRYSPESGEFRWIASRGGWGANRIAGRLNPDGYRRIGIDGAQYPAHVLAWLYMTGEWPAGVLDHADCDRDNNRWPNLRAATQSLNLANARLKPSNTSGFKGVSRTASGKWLATIKVQGCSRGLGTYATPEAAHDAYCRAAKEAFGKFARAS